MLMSARTLVGVMATLALLAGIPAHAQEAPALRNASATEKARIAGLIEGAKKEGSLSYWDVIIQPETHDALSAAFRRHYGLPASFQVNYTLSVTTNLITRVEQELSAGNVTIDVAGIAAPTWAFERVRAGDILQYDSPEYARYERVFAEGYGQKGYFAINGGYFFVPMWSEDHLKFAGKSYRDVLKAVPNGRISLGDGSKSTTYLATYIGLKSVLDPGFFRDLAAKKPNLLVRSEQQAARVVSGEDVMTFTGTPPRAYQSNQKGARLKFMLPDEGVVLHPQAMFITAKAPHPNAAKLWVDFVLSEEGQQILVQGEALISGRAGFKSPVPDYAPALDALKVIKIDWRAMTGEQLKKERAEWTGLFNP
jgi:iron(III) transport system substrate-binding protein